MADRIPRVTRGSADDHAEELLNTARKLKKGIDRRADGYLDGTYDPKKEIRKGALKGATTALVMLSLLTGLAFSSATLDNSLILSLISKIILFFPFIC